MTEAEGAPAAARPPSPARERARALREAFDRDLDVDALWQGTRALADDFPEDPIALNAHAVACHYRRDTPAAEAMADRTLRLEPANRTARLVRALGRLREGRYRDGWGDYLHRIGPKALARSRAEKLPAEHRWTGGPVHQPLLLVPEQGLGDSIQFLRLVPMATARGVRLAVEVEPRLVPLVDGAPGFHAVARPGARLQVKSWAMIADLLPMLMPTREDVAGSGRPYLAPVASRVPGAALSGLSGLRVGIAWRGSPRHADDRHRSMRLADLAPLLDVPGIALASLSATPLDPDADPSVDADVARHVRDLSGASSPVTALSAVIAGLDAVVTVDTFVGHLAAAMGKPTFVLLSFLVDWRWGTEGETTPWYDSMTLVRQERLGDWSAPVRTVAERLAAGRI